MIGIGEDRGLKIPKELIFVMESVKRQGNGREITPHLIVVVSNDEKRNGVSLKDRSVLRWCVFHDSVIKKLFRYRLNLRFGWA